MRGKERGEGGKAGKAGQAARPPARPVSAQPVVTVTSLASFLPPLALQT